MNKTEYSLTTKIQKKYLKLGCPNCKNGKLHEVPNPDMTEIYLWCDTCDLSMDSSGGYVA